MVKRIYTSLQVIFSVSTGLSAILIFSYALFYLQIQERTETKIEENVVLRFNQPTEYLEAIARGETPRWDSDKGGYVYGNSESAEMSMGGGSSSYSDPQAESEPDGDLPF